MEMVDEFIWTLEDTAAFVGGRVVAAIRRYLEVMLPPLAAALMKFTQEYEYSWHTPGHPGGTAFLKSPVGRIFFDYFGENLLRSDLSISVGSLGSLLDHTGPIGEHEKYAARVFGAHRTYCVTNGTSMSNRVIFMAAVARDQIALCDRNCHKSIEHSLVMTGGIPTYFVPLRNRYGIIGPIPPARLKKEAIKAAIKANPLVSKGIDTRAVYSVVTNSTYDGLCYNARRVEELLDPSVDRIHFDEAWYAYARFNPLYRDRHAMHGDPKDHKGPTVFATHSTHKLLAALSQASFLHIRDGRSPIPHSRFNESFMMHASTSPLYAIIVSNDITAAMMDGPGGPTLTNESIEEAVAFRQTMGRVHRRVRGEKRVVLQDVERRKASRPKAGKKVRFEDAPPERLATDPRVLGAASRRDVARLRRPGRRLLHARPDQGVDRDAGRRRQGRPRQARHPGEPGHEVPALLAASKSRRPPISRSWSCSRSASPRASGERSSTRCSSSSATTTATRRSRRCCPHSPPMTRGSTGARVARARRPDVRAVARLAADALARRGVLDAAGAGDDAERGVSAPRPRRDRARAARQAGRTACSRRASCRIRPGFRCSCRASRRGRATVRTWATCGRWRRGTSASPASGTIRTASRIATASSTCSA